MSLGTEITARLKQFVTDLRREEPLTQDFYCGCLDENGEPAIVRERHIVPAGHRPLPKTLFGLPVVVEGQPR